MAEYLVGSLGGHDFALRSDQIVETLPVTSVSRFMRTGRADVVAAVVDDAVRFLSDPVVRLGLASSDHDGTTAVVTSVRSQVTGLLFSGTPQKIVVDDADLFPVAATIGGAPFSACFRYGGRFIGVLSPEFLASLEEPVVPSPVLSLTAPDPASEWQSGFLVLTLGGRPIAVDASNLRRVPGVLEGLVPLASGDGLIMGIAAFEGEMTPVVDVRAALQRDRANPVSECVIWSTANGAVALAVEAAAYQADASDSVYPVHRLLRTADMTSALVEEAVATPIVDLASALGGDGRPAQNPYHAVSDVAGRNRREDLAVYEVSYGAFTYAVPESEVSDTASDLTEREFAMNHPLVDNVVLADNELLPVLNLSRYLGHTHSENTTRETLLIRSGDFTAAIRPERVVGKRIVTVKDQRPLPVEVPHGVLYGCYVDGSDVRLILNLAAIARHAKDTSVQSALATLGRGSEGAVEVAASTREDAASAAPGDDPVADAPEASAAAEEPASDGSIFDVVAESPAMDHDRMSHDQHSDGPTETAGSSVDPVSETPDTDAGSDAPRSAPQPIEEPAAETSTALHSRAEPDAIAPGEKATAEETTAEETPGREPATAGTLQSRADEEQPTGAERRRSRRWLLVALPVLLLMAAGVAVLFAPRLTDRLLARASGIDQPFAERDSAGDSEGSSSAPGAPLVAATDSAVEPPSEAAAGARGEDVGVPRTVRTVERVYFEADSSQLLPVARRTLEQLADAIDDPSDWRLSVVGHTARAGTPSGAQRLSERRAQVVHDYLLPLLSESPSSVDVRAFGASQPAASNATDEGMARNRRAVVTFEPLER